MTQPTSKPLPEEDAATLKSLAIDAFMTDALRGGAAALADRSNPLRLNFFSTAMRMLFEHVMGALAPEEEVRACDWYKSEDGQLRPTRRQRIQYWLQGGLSDEFLIEELDIEPAPLRAKLVKAYDQLSKHVHGREDTIVSDPDRQDEEAGVIIKAVRELLQAYHDCRHALIDPLSEALDDEAVNALTMETIQGVDELASHYSVEEVYTSETEVVAINAHFVRYKATGTIAVILQWGSNSDLRRGDGAEAEKSFPFECAFDVPVDDPRDLSNADVTAGVDTSSWFEGRYDPD